MKGPHDDEGILAQKAETSGRSNKPREKLRGGKVLQRLMAFSEQRDLPLLSDANGSLYHKI